MNDEKTRAEIIDFLQGCMKQGCCDVDKWIAWIEEQSESVKSCWKPSKEQLEAFNHFVRSIGESGYASHYDNNTKLLYSLLHDLEQLEKQGEQNYEFNGIAESRPAKGTLKNLVSEVKEPKFKIGDWIINESCDICLITDIDLENGYYICESNRFGNTEGDIDLTDKAFRLWSIADAKDGDVLCVKYGNDEMPFIFTGKQDDVAYCALNSFGEFVLSLAEWLLNACVLPATKEQRKILFQKMKEANYSWDTETKKLSQAIIK